MRETEPSAMLVADARLLADERILGAIRLHDRSLPGHAALQLFRAGGIGGTRRDITFAAGHEDARSGDKQRENNGFHGRL